MNVFFWGVRGSLATPLLPEQLKAKIDAVVQRIQVCDLESVEARQRFLSSLPESIYGTVGGNTPCVQIVSKSGRQIVLDAGSGICAMEKKMPVPKSRNYAVFLSHLHIDHIQGLLNFEALQKGRVTLDIYSPFENAASYIAQVMSAPFCQNDFSLFKSRVRFHTVSPGKPFKASGLDAVCCRLNHPGIAYAYSISEGGKSLVYASDVELYDASFKDDRSLWRVFRNADAAILDAQYTPRENVDMQSTGHSPFSYSIDFAAEMNIKRVYLFHHAPCRDDKTLYKLLRAARLYSHFVAEREVEVELAVEGRGFRI